VVVHPQKLLENAWVSVADGRVRALGRGRPPRDAAVLDHGAAVLMPTLVNAHTHLELTGMAGRVSPAGGFLAWVRRLVAFREGCAPAAREAALEDGLQELAAAGCGLAGDVRAPDTPPSHAAAPELTVFREVLGDLTDPSPPEPGEAPAAHAPHSTHPALIARRHRLARRRGQMFGIHLAESPEEVEFICTGRGPWAEFLDERDIHWRGWGLPARSPVQHLADLGVLDRHTLAVHLVQTDARDWARLADGRVRTCLCPRSNLALSGTLPDLPGLLGAGLRPALGTDSRASVASLSLFDEMAAVARAFPQVPPATVLAMATLYGAEALGREADWGSLLPGRRARLLRLPMAPPSAAALLERLTTQGTPPGLEVLG
jgi:cytosine/adenosine deaminase-related metal-dependent hydrolase